MCSKARLKRSSFGERWAWTELRMERSKAVVPMTNPPAPAAANQSPPSHRVGAVNTYPVSSANNRSASRENALSGRRSGAALESGGAGVTGSEATPELRQASSTVERRSPGRAPAHNELIRPTYAEIRGAKEEMDVGAPNLTEANTPL